MYACTLFVGVNNTSTIQPIIGVERTIFYRERAARMYTAIPYALSQVCIFAHAALCFCVHTLECAWIWKLEIKRNHWVNFTAETAPHWGALQFHANVATCWHPVPHDFFSMDGHQILLVLLLCIHLISLLHLFWYDACGGITECCGGFGYRWCLSELLEPLLRLPHSWTGEPFLQVSA